MNRPTPGPWQQGQLGDARVYGPDGQGEDSGLVANVYKTARPNVRLIVASCNAVQRLAEHLGRDPVETAEGLDLVALVDALKNAQGALDNANRSAGVSTAGFHAIRKWNHAAEIEARAALAMLRGEK